MIIILSYNVAENLHIVKEIFCINETCIQGEIMTNLAASFDGKKFMWDKGDYDTEGEAMEKISQYEKEGFETQLVKGEAEYLVYTRRIVKEIVLEEGGQSS
jgi:hypothetical protein